jgi:hypothetical protein
MITPRTRKNGTSNVNVLGSENAALRAALAQFRENRAIHEGKTELPTESSDLMTALNTLSGLFKAIRSL